MSGYGASGGADEELLRRVLRTEAEKIEVRPDALAVIQDRIRSGGPSRSSRSSRSSRAAWPRWVSRSGGAAGFRWSPLAVGAGTLLTASVAAVAIGLAGLAPMTSSEREPSRVGGGRELDRASAPGPSAEGTASTVPAQTAPPDPTMVPDRVAAPPAPAGPAGGTSSAAVAVYYLGEGGGAQPPMPRLYREFHRLGVGDGSAEARVGAAVRRMLDPRGAHDPDYTGGWPAGARLRGVRVGGSTATVDLSGAGDNDLPVATARQAVQQLVWTVTAVTGVTGVRIRLDGVGVDRLWDRVDVPGVLHRAPAVDVLGLVWLISPQHGAVVGRTFEVHVAGIVPEATAQLRIRQGGRTIVERVVTLSAGGPAQGERRLRLTLPPGEYQLQAYAESLDDGSERYLDDHTVTVR